MPASPARALRGRVRRLAAGVCASALISLAHARRHCRRPRDHRQRDLARRVGRTRPRWGRRCSTRRRWFRAAAPVADVCDTTLVHVDGRGHADAAAHSPGDRARPTSICTSIAVTRSGTRRPWQASPPTRTPTRRSGLPNAGGTYLVPSGVVRNRHGRVRRSGDAPISPLAPPPVDGPRGREETLVSDHRAGAASQPVVAVSPRDRDVLVAAYRVFSDPAAYVSQIATAVSFDRGERWLPLVPSRAPGPPTRRWRSRMTATRCSSPTSSRRPGTQCAALVTSSSRSDVARPPDVGSAGRTRRSTGRLDPRGPCSPQAATAP